MTHNYRMTVDGSEFSVIDDLGATISVCKTEREAWWKKLSQRTCECTTLTAKRRSIGLGKRRTSFMSHATL
jgi:hypothetical protein